ncbi:hypothetical protein I7I50_01589 [Histoplasma capsulatum G186AR]|nr:hypothetical protein I7I50_01589 [Histoplasma capsulatum G186AR]
MSRNGLGPNQTKPNVKFMVPAASLHLWVVERMNPGKKASTMEIWDGTAWIGKEPAPLNTFILE